MDDAHVRGAERADVLLELSRPSLVHLDRHDVAREHRRLPARRGTEIEHALPCLRADAQRSQLRAAALRPDPALGERLLVDPVDTPGSWNVGALPLDLPAHEPDDRLGRLVLGAHQRQRSLLPEVAAPDVPDPVRIRVLERPLRQPGQKRRDSLGDSPQNRVRERDGPLEVRAAHELDRLVHGGITRDTAEVAELVRAEPECRQHGRIELSHRALPERLDRMIERPQPLHRAECELARERPVAIVEALDAVRSARSAYAPSSATRRRTS